MTFTNRSATSRHHSASRIALFTSLLVLAGLVSSCKDGGESKSQSNASSKMAHEHPTGESCFIEDPSKREAGRLWCKEHGVYEDRCWECHPELRDETRPFCDEHGLYEDECHLCDPSRATKNAPAGQTTDGPVATSEGDKGADSDEKANGDVLLCNEHNLPEHECGICHPDLANTLPVGDSLAIRLASKRSADLAGVTTARPEQAEGASSIELLGEIQFDGNHLAKITPLAGGVITKINVDVGQEVEAGAILAVVNAPDVAEAKAAYLSAQAELQKWKAASKRQSQLFDDKIGSQRAMENAVASANRAQVTSRLARERLLNLGVTTAQLRKMRDSRSALRLRAPFKGSVVNRTAVLGEAVDTSKALFEIADLSQMWVELSVPTEHAGSIREGTPIRVTLRALDQPPIEGQITWVSPLTDERTRMVRARGVLPNADRLLRHGMFANVSAQTSKSGQAMRLPASAIHQIDNHPFVFTKLEEDLYAARRVEVSRRLPSDEFLVLSGIRPEDEIVMTGGFSIKSALLAERLGAGCTDD